MMAIAISCSTDNKQTVVEKPIPSEFSILGIKLGDSRQALMDCLKYPMKNYHQVSFEIFNNDYNEDDYSFFRW